NSTHYGAFEIEETQNKAIAGIGARYAVSKSVGVRAEYTKYAADFSAFGVGVDFSF
ncbi:hypothetical protein, partial [Chitinimonas sp.]|uniref:hypothetical protein n=1 Tax=Chitinimonas sp. TaxID=1934313 RepID=UPI0035B2C71E